VKFEHQHRLLAYTCGLVAADAIGIMRSAEDFMSDDLNFGVCVDRIRNIEDYDWMYAHGSDRDAFANGDPRPSTESSGFHSGFLSDSEVSKMVLYHHKGRDSCLQMNPEENFRDDDVESVYNLLCKVSDRQSAYKHVAKDVGRAVEALRQNGDAQGAAHTQFLISNVDVDSQNDRDDHGTHWFAIAYSISW